MKYEDLPTEDLVEIARLDQEIQALNHKQSKTNKAYDESMDGSREKREALISMRSLGDELREKWARVNEILDKVDED
jgi:predicted  nucleic acid-binding Zn-ribbon protein